MRLNGVAPSLAGGFAVPYTVSTYYGTGLLTKALKIEVEIDGRLTLAGKC